MKTTRLWLGACCATLGLFAAGCDNSSSSSSNNPGGDDDAGSGLSGQVTADGSSTVFPITEAAAKKFSGKHPKVKVTVGMKGTGGGFKVFTAGESDISDASRPITTAEFDQCKKNGVKFIELPIAYDGLTVVVNPKNTFVEQLTIDDLKKIFRDDMKAKTWKEVNPEWPDEIITIFAPGTNSGTFDYFKEILIAKDEKVGIRGDMSASENDSILVNGVAGDEHAIGFFGAAYYFSNKDKLKAVNIVDPHTQKAVAPTKETIESGEYAPFGRPLFIYISLSALDRLEVEEFVDFYLNNAGELASEVRYVPLPADIYKTARERFDKRETGTCYLDKEGNKRSGSLAEVYNTAANLRKE
jgi:phosphate transport system substrate-binding protein